MGLSRSTGVFTVEDVRHDETGLRCSIRTKSYETARYPGARRGGFGRQPRYGPRQFAPRPSAYTALTGTTTETCRRPGHRERVCTSYRHAGGWITAECR